MTNQEVQQAVARLLVKEFTAAKNGQRQNRHTASFYSKMKKFLPAEVCQTLEQSPEEDSTLQGLEAALAEQCKKQGIMMNCIMYHENYSSGR